MQEVKILLFVYMTFIVQEASPSNLTSHEISFTQSSTNNKNNNASIVIHNVTQELKYYPDEGRGADGYISSFFESFWPFRTHRSNLRQTFTPSPLLEVSESKRDQFILDFCRGRFQGDIEDLKKSLSDFKIPFNSDLYALQTLICLDPSERTSTNRYYEDEIITKSPEREFVVQSGFSYDSLRKRDYYPSGGNEPRVGNEEGIPTNPFFIPSSNRRSDSNRSLLPPRHRRVNPSRHSPPKPAIMSGVKFYPATVQDFLDAPGRPFIKKLPTLELRQKSPSLSFPHFPRRVAPEQEITPRFPAKTSSTSPTTSAPITSSTVTQRLLSKFVAYEATPDVHRKRVVIKPRKHVVQGGTRRSRIRVPHRKNPPYDSKKEAIASNRGDINISTIIHSKRPQGDIKQFGTQIQNVRLTPYSAFERITEETPISTPASSRVHISTPPSTTAPTASLRSLEIRPSLIYGDVIQEIIAPTSFHSPENYPFGAKQVVESEPFLPEEALILENEVFTTTQISTTERPQETTETLIDPMTTLRVVNAQDFLPPPTSSNLPSIDFTPEESNKEDYYDDIETIIGDLSDVAFPSPVEQDNIPKSKGSAQKLAYILIGVCCGLSILCLIVVVVSLGYKSERSLLGVEMRRNLFRRIMTSGYLNNNGRSRFSSGGSSIHEKTSTSRLTGATNSADSPPGSSSNDEQPSHKLGSWFNGKLHNIQTLDRKKKEKVFPTNVYLDNLNDLVSESKKADKDNEEADNEDDAFSVEELFESRSKVVSNASSSSPSISLKSRDKPTTTTNPEADDSLSSSSFPPPPPPLEPEISHDAKSKASDDDEEEEVVLSKNYDRLI